MQDNVSVLIATIIFVIIIVLFPIYNVAARNDSIANNMIIEATTSFVDDVRNKGYIDQDSYYKFVYDVEKTGNMYDIELEVYNKVIVQDKSGNYYDDYEIDYTKDVLEVIGNKYDKISPTLTPEQKNIAISALSDILNDKVLVSNIYPLEEGDKVYVRIKNTNLTQAQVLFYNLFKGDTNPRIVVNYGGEVFKNELVKSKTIFGTNSNISISRPMYFDGTSYVEYTMKLIAIDSIEEGITENIYGIAVPINLTSKEIYFELKYSDVNSVLSVDDLKNLVSLSGFTGDVRVDTITANSEYRIAIENVKTIDEVEQSECYITLKEGSAIASTGEIVGLVQSPEFIIYQDREPFEIGELQALQLTNEHGGTFDVAIKGYTTTDNTTDKKVKIEFTAPEIGDDGRTIGRYIWQISNENSKPISVTAPTGETVEWLIGDENRPAIVRTTSRTITVEFDEKELTDVINGSYVKVRGVDSSGIYSKTKGVAFAAVANYMDNKVTGYVANVGSLMISGATVDSATFNLEVSDGHSTSGYVNRGDRYRIIGIDIYDRKVILVDRNIEELKEYLKNIYSNFSGNSTEKSNLSKQADYSKRIKYDTTSMMYYIDDNENDIVDTNEYYLANDITLSGYRDKIGFKTSTFGYGSSDPAEDYSLYYWVKKSLENLTITVNDDAKTKYKSLIFDYKIYAGHMNCINENDGTIKCTLKSYFAD